MFSDLAPYLDAIDRELRAAVQGTGQTAGALYDMMGYHLGWLDERFAPMEAPQGKRLRPLLCLLACEACTGDWVAALPGACAVELIHNFTLLHDDIEDKSPTRRHRPTVWSLWGVAQGINTGDALWAVARLAAYRLLDRGHSPATVLEVARRLDSTCLALCAGQHLDLDFEQRSTVSLQEYEHMISGKTAALLSASTAIGALLAGAPSGSVTALESFGRELGLAFQMVDDLLGIWGDPAVTGKSASSDLVERKKTLPVIYALAQEKRQGQCRLAERYGRPSCGDEDVSAILEMLEAAGAREHTRQRAQAHHDRALACLTAAGCRGQALRALCSLTDTLTDRNH